MTPVFKEKGEGWLQKRRLGREKYRASLEKAYSQYEKNPNAIIFRVALVILAVFTLIVGQIVLAGGLILTAMASAALPEEH